MTHLVLAGRPGSGKTQFCDWLVQNYGFVHIETDQPSVWAEWATRLVVPSAIRAQETLEHAMSLGDDVVVEWGFMPEYLPALRLLRRAGFSNVFFDGDEPTCGALWRQRRPEEPWEPYEAQILRLKEAWPALTHFYRGRIVRTVEAGPVFTPFENIAHVVLAN